MRPAALAIFLTSMAALAAGEESDAGAAFPGADIRREILAPYRFVPHQAEPSPPPPFLARQPPQPGNAHLAMPAQSDFREPHMLNHLDAAILREQAGARTALVASRLGIGVTSVRLGRHVALGAATAFYIPVAIGLGIVW